ncbi:MAG: LPS-assembly protein LptD [Ignavibacteriae bacterium]|nr:LPS-assembly protein LptD [Ignavibacteriota bacterium]
MIRFSLIFPVFLILCTISVHGEDRSYTGAFSCGLPQARIDSLDTALVLIDDSLTAEPDTAFVFPVKNAVDTLVTYAAKDSVVYRLRQKRMALAGSSSIAYGAMNIKAERLVLDWDSSTIRAEGVPDTAQGAGAKSLGRPVLKDGGESYEGESMTYNFRTKQGVISQGETSIDDGFYLGKRIKRKSEKTYFVEDGQYTTCDNPDHKHFYFGSPKMKFVPDDVIIAEPIYFFVEDIPLFALPFAVIPSQGGRSSGIILPAFGYDYARGRYLTNGGYYLAASDYWDARFTGDIFSKGGYRVGVDLNYKLRYAFAGSIKASYGRQTFQIGSPYLPDDQPRTEYRFDLQHQQELDPQSTITANISYLTSSYYQSFSNNINQLLNQNVYSTAAYSTAWEGTGRSLSVNMSRNQNLQDGTSNNVLPDITFNQSQVFPFRSGSGTGTEAWYEMIGFNYTAHFKNSIDILKHTRISNSDTSVVSAQYDRRGISHSVGFLLTPKLGYITISPSLSLTERWYDHRLERSYDRSTNSVVARDVRGFYALHGFQSGVAVSTKLYGTLSPNIAGIQGVRHTVEPRLSYTYNPDFSTPGWGMYQSYRDSLDREVRYDPYTGYAERPAEVFGGVSAFESQTLGFQLSNIFEMKLDPAEADTTMTPRKFRLLDISLGSAYNFVSDSLNLSDVNLDYRTNIGGLFDVYGRASFSPYQWQSARYGLDTAGALVMIEQGHVVNSYLAQTGGPLRLTTFDFHLTSTLTQELFTSSTRDTSAMPASTAYRIPWSLSFGFDYGMDQYNPDAQTRSASMRANLSISPTPGWHVTAGLYYDLPSRTLGTPSLNITRDLHCWEMMFNWVPAGPYRSFSLVIRVKAPQLQDIKLERKGSDRGVYGY